MTHAQMIMAMLAAALWMMSPGGAAHADPASDAAATVTAFNAALTERDLERSVAYLLEGGTQFNLQPAHSGFGSQQGISSDLRAHWSMVASVLFSATKSYTRTAEIVHTRAENGLATVWTNTTTESVRADKAEPAKARFSEVYLLVQKDGQWKIGAMADSRAPDDVGGAGSQPGAAETTP